MGNCDLLDKTGTSSTIELISDSSLVLDHLTSSNEVRPNNMADCACECYIRHLDEFARVYDETGDIDDVLDVMHSKIPTLRLFFDDDVVYITKAARFPSTLSRPSDTDRSSLCHCAHARASDVGESPAYCYCGAGWMQKIWEGILKHPVRVEITKSVFKGDDVCQFAVHV